MKIDYDQLTIHNFKSIANLKFYLHRTPGVHFISGVNKVEPRLESNGAGKSTIFDALTWCLYGKTVDGERNPDIIPWNGKESPAVILQVRFDDKINVITRTAQPNRLRLNDGDIDQTSLEHKLGLSFEVFTHTILLGQEMPLFFDLTPGRKMELFGEVLDLKRWEKRAAVANRVSNEMQSEIEQEKGAIEGLVRQWDDTKKLYTQTREQSQIWEAELAARLEEANATMATIRKQLKAVQDRHDDANLLYDGAHTEIVPLQRELQQLNEYLRHNNDEKNKLELKIKLAVQEQQRIVLDLMMLKEGTCPLCGQKTAGALNDHRLELESKLVEVKKRCNAGPFKALQKVGGDLMQQIVVLEKKQAELKKCIIDNREILDAQGPRLTELKTKLTLLVDAQRLAQEQSNPLSAQVQNLRKARDKLKTEIDNRMKVWRIAVRKAERTRFWFKGFKDLQLQIIEEVLQELELCSNVMLDQLGLVGWSLHYAIEKELKGGGTQRGLNVSVRSPHNRQPVRWESWSGGERQRLRLLGALALSETLLNRAGIEPNLEILDEPTAHLTPRGVTDLCNFLHDRAEQLQRIILLVDQNTVASDRFVSAITVTRSGKGTSLTVQ